MAQCWVVMRGLARYSQAAGLQRAEAYQRRGRAPFLLGIFRQVSNQRSCRDRPIRGPACRSYGNESRRGAVLAAVPVSPCKQSRSAGRRNGRSS
jgi:hypothetical protein